MSQIPMDFNPPDPIVAEHARMMRQRDVRRRNARMGEPTGRQTVEARFRQFHADNPHVYTRLVAMARRLRSQGHRKYGLRCLFEVLRFEHDISTTTNDPFKLNNDYCARYARLIMAECTDLADFFETRELKTL